MENAKDLILQCEDFLLFSDLNHSKLNIFENSVKILIMICLFFAFQFIMSIMVLWVPADKSIMKIDIRINVYC